MIITLNLYTEPWCDCTFIQFHIYGIIEEPCDCSLKEWLINDKGTFMNKRTKRREIKQNIPIYNVKILK